MPFTLSLRPLASACRSCVTQSSKAFLSSNGPRNAQNITNSNASRDLLDVDGSNRSRRGPAPQRTSNGGGFAMLDRMVRNTGALNEPSRAQQADEMTRISAKRQELARYMPRKWVNGEVYSPHDLSPSEMNKWRSARRPAKDIIDLLGINPLDHYKNFSIISEYMTEFGRIKHSRMTGLRPVNQRKMAKAIRRAVGMGIHPSTHKHPMILYSLDDLNNFVDLKAKLARQKSE